MKKALFSVICFLFALTASAQEILVTDGDTGKPLDQVFVHTTDLKRSVSTAKDGKADLSALLPIDSLHFRHTGYHGASFSLEDVEALTYHISLLPIAYEMPAFQIVNAREQLYEHPQKVKRISAQEIQRMESRSTAELLENTGQVFVQRSQLGGGSPILRGFEANRILLVIDGVRMNNAIYRSGHLQNALTVDPFILEGTDVVYGPASLIYGSDALGGVIHFRSKQPQFSSSDKPELNVNAAQRWTAGAQASASHMDVEVSGKKLAWISSASVSELGEMRMGRKRLHGEAGWGQAPEYVQHLAGRDTVIQNADPNVIRNSGYTQYDLLNKLAYQIDDSLKLTLNVQYSTTTDIPRTDQLLARRDGQLRYAEWAYGPQERLLASLYLDLKGENQLYDEAGVILAYQKVGEDRVTRNLHASERFLREEDVDVFSLNVDMVKKLKGKMDLYYGIEATNNLVRSEARLENILTGDNSRAPTRYPDGGSRMSTTAAYVDMNKKCGKKTLLGLGLRYSHSYLDSKFQDTSFYSLPYSDIRFDKGALTGALRLEQKLDEQLRFMSSISTGFRSPNVDDYGKVFERAGIVVVPTQDLDPEYTLNGEMRLVHQRGKGSTGFEAGLFYTHIYDAIVLRETSLNGADSLEYEGTLARVAMNLNADEAMIYGYNLAMEQALAQHWEMQASVTQTFGEVIGREEYLAHIPPLFAKLGLMTKHDTWSIGAFVLYNDTKTNERIGPGRTDNGDEGLNGAFPSWYTININSSLHISEHLLLRFNLINLTDIHYKAFASGVSAPGRTATVSVRMSI